MMIEDAPSVVTVLWNWVSMVATRGMLLGRCAVVAMTAVVAMPGV